MRQLFFPFYKYIFIANMSIHNVHIIIPNNEIVLSMFSKFLFSILLVYVIKLYKYNLLIKSAVEILERFQYRWKIC